MMHLLLVLGFLALNGISSTHAESKDPLIAQRDYGREEEEKKDLKIRTDVNIKGIDPKNILFDTPIPSSSSPVSTVLYDRASEGDSCFITCNFYNGVTSKWSDFFVDLQPFENFCMALTGCSSQYPSPSEEVVLNVGKNSFVLKMIDNSSNRYYLPLSSRQAISAVDGEIMVEIRGVKMPSYKIGAKNRQRLRSLVNREIELDEFQEKQGTQSLKQKLVEAKELLDADLISEDEYKEMKANILKIFN